MSGTLLVITVLEGYVGMSIVDKLSWQITQLEESDKRNLTSMSKEKIDIILLMTSGASGALIMFIWDYLAYTLSTSN